VPVTENKPTFIVINPHCHQGKGWMRWKSIRSQVIGQLPLAKEMVTESIADLAVQLHPILSTDQQSCIISAGGDGSIHQIANMLLERNEPDKHRLGAIGLGSSNDFLKPFRSFVGNIPVRIRTDSITLQDAGEINYIDQAHINQKRYFIINASMGVTAEGNWHFNNPGKVLTRIKQINTQAAITYTALKTILSYRNKAVRVHFNGTELLIGLSNINLLKVPYVSGSFHYQQNILPDDGVLGLNICANMSTWELVRTLMSLEKGKFHTGPRRISTLVDQFQICSATPIIFECDGETAESTDIRVSVLPQAIQLLNA